MMMRNDNKTANTTRLLHYLLRIQTSPSKLFVLLLRRPYIRIKINL